MTKRTPQAQASGDAPYGASPLHLTPQAFAEKWGKSKLSERSAYQQHFLDLCGMLGQPTPAEVDPEGEFYTFEKGVQRPGERGQGLRRGVA
jgi:hypothetical protein